MVKEQQTLISTWKLKILYVLGALFISCIIFFLFQGNIYAQQYGIENHVRINENKNGLPNSSKEPIYENRVFRNVRVSGSTGKYIVEGELAPDYTSFGYSVDDGHNYIIRDTIDIKNKKKWKDFRLNIMVPPDKFPISGALMLNLYVEPEQSCLLPIPLEYF